MKNESTQRGNVRWGKGCRGFSETGAGFEGGGEVPLSGGDLPRMENMSKLVKKRGFGRTERYTY